MAAGPSLAPSSGPRARWWGAHSSSQWSSSLSTCPSCASRSAALKGETDGVQTDTQTRDTGAFERSNRCVPCRMRLYPLTGASHTKVLTRKFNSGIQDGVWMWMEKAMCELVNGPVFNSSVYSNSVFALMWSSSDAPSTLLTCPCVDKAEVMLWMRTSCNLEIGLNRAPSGRSWNKSNPEAQGSNYAVMLWGLDYNSWPTDRRDSIPRRYCVVTSRPSEVNVITEIKRSRYVHTTSFCSDCCHSRLFDKHLWSDSKPSVICLLLYCFS